MSKLSVLQDAIEAAIERTRLETGDLTYCDVVGILEMVKADIVEEARYTATMENDPVAGIEDTPSLSKTCESCTYNPCDYKDTCSVNRCEDWQPRGDA